MSSNSYSFLKEPTEITMQIWSDNEPPLLSIVNNTYNHEGFIAAAIEGFLMQKTTFKVEILTHDDASIDKTAAIIREYEKKYPDLILPIYQTVNQYSQGIRPNWKYQMPRARGKYIAPCEGDDYWTDPLKLQKQIDFLEANSEYVAVAENGIWKDIITKKERLFNKDSEHDVTIEEMIIKRRFPTASVVFRKSAIDDFSREVRVSNDTIKWCYLASKGKFRYRTNVSSVYNRGMQGVVKSTEILNWARFVEKCNVELIRLFSAKYFDKKYAINHIWLHYWRVYEQPFKKKTLYKSYLALFKCYKYNFRKTLNQHFRFFKTSTKNLFANNV